MVQCIAANVVDPAVLMVFLATNIGNLWGCVFFQLYIYNYNYIYNYIYTYIIYQCFRFEGDKSVHVYQFIRWTSTLNVRCQQTSLASTSVRLNIQCKRLVKFEIRDKEWVWCNYCILFCLSSVPLCQLNHWI